MMGYPTFSSLFVLLISISLSFCAPKARSFACTFTDGEIVSYTLASECLRQIPVNQTYKDMTTQTLASIMQMYAFRDINKNTGAPWNVQVDILKEINRISLTNYQSDYDFQQDLTTVFNQMRDTHTLYSKPACYRFIYLQPFLLNSFLQEQGNQVVSIVPTSCNSTLLKHFEQEYYTLTGFDPSPFYNFEVVQIYDEPALPYLTNWVEENVALLDNGTKANLLFGSFMARGWSQQSVSLYGIPEQDSVTYLVRDRGTGQTQLIDVPWVVVSHVNATGIQSLIEKCTYIPPTPPPSLHLSHRNRGQSKSRRMAPPAESSEATLGPFLYHHLTWMPGMTEQDRVDVKRRLNFSPQVVQMMQKASPAGSKVKVDIHQDKEGKVHDRERQTEKARILSRRELIPLNLTLAQTYGMYFFKLVGVPVAVIRLTVYDQDPAVFEEAIVSWRRQMASMGIEKLIIDVVDNGGGIIENGYKFAALLAGSDLSDIRTLASYDEIHSALMDDLRPFCEKVAQSGSLTGNGRGSRKVRISEGQGQGQGQSKVGNGTQICNSLPADLADVCSCGWELLPEGLVQGPMETYIPATPITRGGSTSLYTPRMILPDWADIMGFFNRSAKESWYKPVAPSNLIIMTNGFCGSTCAVFVRVLQEAHKAKVIGIGGLINNQISSNVFVGGAVYPVSSILAGLNSAKKLGFESEWAPPGFGTNMYFQITRWEMYKDTHPNIPLQFVATPTDARINFWPGCEAPFDSYYSITTTFFYCCFAWENSNNCLKACPSEL